jgi:excisionase family DNA binding protein
MTRRTAAPQLALSIEETCEALTISRWTLYDLIAQGRIRTVMLGRRRLVPMAELERLLSDDAAER